MMTLTTFNTAIHPFYREKLVMKYQVKIISNPQLDISLTVHHIDLETDSLLLKQIACC